MVQPSADSQGKHVLPSWQITAGDKRRDREANLNQFPQWRLRSKVPAECRDVSKVLSDELSPSELEIVQCDATEIVTLIIRRRFTSLQVIKAHCHAAAVAQDLTNCLSEVFFDEALERAKELDDYLQRTGKPYGPLHGLPVSVKDHVMIKGKDTSTGYVAWCYKTVAERDAVAVDILRKAGAVLYVKTNNPQTLLVRSYALLHQICLFIYRLRSRSKQTTTSSAQPQILSIEIELPEAVAEARVH